VSLRSSTTTEAGLSPNGASFEELHKLTNRKRCYLYVHNRSSRLPCIDSDSFIRISVTDQLHGP
jgi:hypothetical protein